MGIPVREIKGIGEKTKNALLKEFKSVKRIKEASAEDIVKVIGEAKAKIIKDYFTDKYSFNTNSCPTLRQSRIYS